MATPCASPVVEKGRAMHVQSAEERDRLTRRLRRIEGQARGVQRMLEEERDCREIIQQLAAIRSAVQQVGLEVMRVYASQCLADPERAASSEDVIDYLVGVLGRWG
jgi:DNA-binding FrmR family transcriptional regulator